MRLRGGGRVARRCPCRPRRSQQASPRPEDLLTANAVASPHHLSARAGEHILRQGGNAVDAAIAVVAAQGVVAPETCGVGGDLFALIHIDGADKPLALNSSGTAGSNASAEELRQSGHTAIPRDHPLVVTVPGCVDGLVTLAETHGTLPLTDTLEPAITLAKEGFPVSSEQARAFSGQAHLYRDHPSVASFYPGGVPVEVGDLVTRPELARTLAEIASGGREAFYGGTPGEDILEVLGPYVTADDLARPVAEWVDPLRFEIEDELAWTIPPNSAGYLGPATLAVFLRTDPPDDPDDPLWWHLLIESHRSLAWEREDTVGDPGSLDTPPRALMATDRLDRAAERISRDHAGTWPTRTKAASGTAYMATRDPNGMAVSIINSNYRGTGSTMGARRSGFLLQDRGAGFNLRPGHPNELGPRKRPAHTLSPTIWTRDSQTSYVLGTRGGEIQPQLIAQLAARAIVNRDDLEVAQAAPRWAMTEYGPGAPSTVSIEPGNGVSDRLRELGHNVIEVDAPQPGWGPMSIIRVDESHVTSSTDPRVDTTAAIVF